MTLRILLAATLGVAFAAPAHAAFVISKDATSNVTCTGNRCKATAADAVLNVKQLREILKTSDLTIVSGKPAQDITFNISLNWASPYRLTVSANRSITFTQPVTVEGAGGVTLVTNDGGTGGDYSFTGKGKIAFWDLTSILIINGKSFTLVNDLATLAADIAKKRSGRFALAQGYDASVDGIYAHAPIPTTFLGTLEGLGHSIMNLSITSTGDAGVGLFAAVNGAWLRDIGIVNATIVVNGAAKTGTLVGDAEDVVIIGCASTGTISGSGDDVGGLVGDFVDLDSVDSTSNVQADVAISGTFQIVGGLIGNEINNRSDIEVAHASGAVKVTSAQYAGGLVGHIDGEMELAYATGDVVAGPGSRAGGLIGGGSAGLSGIFATGDVTGGPNSQIGGLIGDFAGFFVGAFATGRLHGTSVMAAGGLLGTFEPGTTNLYWAYSVVDLRHVTGDAIGGVIGNDKGNAPPDVDLYWDLNVTGIHDPHRGAGIPVNDPGITGLTDTQLKSGLPDGFDPSGWSENPDINNGYPYFTNFPPPH